MSKKSTSVFRRIQSAITAFRDPTGIASNLGHSLGSGFRLSGDGDCLDNAYADIVKAANGFAKIEPFFVDRKNKPTDSPLLNALYRPNNKMSASQFRKNLAINLLVHDKFYLLLLDNKSAYDEPVRSISQVTGYDILLPTNVSLDDDGRVISTMLKKQNVSVNPNRVLEISDVLDPRDLSRGYAAYRAMMPWAKLDDLNRQMQEKYYARGGTPNGQFNIIADTNDKYQTVKNSIIESMANGGGNNEPIFSHTPLVNGKPGVPMVTWQQIQSNARDMTTSDIIDFTERRLSSPIGVPNEIKGFLSNSNYASVIMAEWIFYDSVVDPIAKALYDKLTAEASNVFGDIGGSFTYESARPAFADEDYKKAQTDTVNIGNIKALTDQGYTTEGAIEILGLPARYLAMADKKYRLDNFNVQDGDDTPDSTASRKPRAVMRKKVAQSQPVYCPLKIDLKKYSEQLKYIVTAYELELSEQVAKNDMLIKAADDESDEERQKRLRDEEELAVMLTAIITMTVFELGNKRVGPGLAFLRSINIPTDNLATAYTGGDQRLSRSINNYRKNKTPENMRRLISNIQSTSSPVVRDLRDHLRTVARNHSEYIRQRIVTTISKARAEGLGADELADRLGALIDGKDAERLAVSETHRADELQKVDQVRYWAKQTGARALKSVRNDGAHPCEYCQSLAGQWFELDNPIVGVGETIDGTLGGHWTNNYENIEGAHIHPYCECQTVFMIAIGEIEVSYE